MPLRAIKRGFSNRIDFPVSKVNLIGTGVFLRSFSPAVFLTVENNYPSSVTMLLIKRIHPGGRAHDNTPVLPDL